MTSTQTEQLTELLEAIRSGDSVLTNSDAHGFAEALESAIADVRRMDFMQLHGVDWDGLSGYFHKGGSHSGISLRECVDNAMQSNTRINPSREGASG